MLLIHKKTPDVDVLLAASDQDYSGDCSEAADWTRGVVAVLCALCCGLWLQVDVPPSKPLAAIKARTATTRKGTWVQANSGAKRDSSRRLCCG